MLKAGAGFEKRPYVEVTADASRCAAGWPEILARLRSRIRPGRFTVCVECYPGVFVEEIARVLEEGLRPDLMLLSEQAFRSPREINEWLTPALTDDPVFGCMRPFELAGFFEGEELERARQRVKQARGLTIVIGAGAAEIALEPDLLLYADMARWEIQQRQRGGESGNLGASNERDDAGLKYKRAFFVDWRAADRLKTRLFDSIEFLLDTNDRRCPKMISGDDFRAALAATVRRPFSVVPLFDPGSWGGQWMKQKFDLPRERPNYAWCFNCVPEENSLLLAFGSHRVEIPAIDLVFRHPRELLGECVYSRFGAEFPIRFDFLDTMGGGNLSLQVHPLREYIRAQFGMSYTQEESYYILECGADALVFLGLKEGVDRAQMESDLRMAQDCSVPFPAERYVNRWPANKHDHFLIPPGTVHCSGANSVVLEVSATPYIFTFKLWDWNRLGLDGRPRPIHLDHGLANIQWERTTCWVRDELINRIEPVAAGQGWREERTGLHELEFIETRRHWFTEAVPHDTAGTVNVINLVEGDAVLVESPEHAFEPFAAHYAETFIVPAAVGRYTVRPQSNARHATLKASVRPQ